MDIRGEFRFAAAALVATQEAFVTQNRGFAAKIAAAAAYRRLVEIEDLQRLSEDDREWAGAGACQDLAMTFGVSATVASDWADWGTVLPARYPATWAMVQAGRIQESHVRMLARKLDTCSDGVVRRIERAVGEAAVYVSVTRLGWEIEDLIARADPDEAASRRERRAAARTVRRRHGGDGLAEVVAVLTTIEGEIVEQCLASIASTVCPDDKRGHKQMRADSFMALIQGHRQLKCLCGNDTCPFAFYEPVATVQTHLHLHVDFEVLLRLVDDIGEPDDTTDAADGSDTDGTQAQSAGSTKRQEWELSGIGWWISQVHTRITTDPDLLHPDGHGPYDTPPAGALRYKPAPGVRREVFSTYSTCSFPPCLRPSRLCEFEHAEPYNHADPRAGGWSIKENGHPAHKFHHDLKTLGHYRVAVLADGAVVWTSRTGAIGVTVPDILPTGHHPAEVPVMRPAWEQHPDAGNIELPDDHPIYEATWWENVMGEDATAPTLTEIAGIDDPELRAQCEELRARYDEHTAIVDTRKWHAPCPF